MNSRTCKKQPENAENNMLEAKVDQLQVAVGCWRVFAEPRKDKNIVLNHSPMVLGQLMCFH